jgi:hypothetical protein
MPGSGEGARSSGVSQSVQIGQIQGDFVVVAATAATTATLGPFVNAFCAELGRRLGGTMADWVSRVRADRRPRAPDRVDLSVQVGMDTVSTTIALEGGSSDEAMAAHAVHAAHTVSQAVLERGLQRERDADAGTWAPPS